MSSWWSNFSLLLNLLLLSVLQELGTTHYYGSTATVKLDQDYFASVELRTSIPSFVTSSHLLCSTISGQKNYPFKLPSCSVTWFAAIVVAVVSYPVYINLSLLPALTFWFADLYPRTVHPRISSALLLVEFFFSRPPPFLGFICSRANKIEWIQFLRSCHRRL